ncbi:MAG: acetolactate decarboxylase [Verrucomicrobiota bacterium]
MKKFLIVLLCVVALGGCCRECPIKPTTTTSRGIVQISTIGALMEGLYDGQISCRELLTYGNLGIGTFAGLDGEMVVLDGTVFQIKADGKVYRPHPETKTPFAVVAFWNDPKEIFLEKGMNLDAVMQKIDALLQDKNIFYAVKLRGVFSKMKTRSVPAQIKPYPPLAEVVKNQPIFDFENISGVVVGFRTPEYMKTITVPGWHLHFLSDDRASGGHILDFEIEEGAVQIDEIRQFSMILPSQGEEFSKVNLEKERSDELRKIEGK